MKLVDLDGVMFVPVVDETYGGAVVEMKMTVGEFFEKCCAGFAPETIDAIPVEWLKHMISVWKKGSLNNTSIEYVLEAWRIEQEAKQ